MNDNALQILNDVITISLASYTSSILQVYDISIYGPFKKYVSSEITIEIFVISLFSNKIRKLRLAVFFLESLNFSSVPIEFLGSLL